MKQDFRKLKEVSGTANFFLYPEKLVSKFGMPQITTDFLTKVGIPPIESDLINFYGEADKIVELEYKKEQYLVIGDDFGTKICVKIKTGEIYSIDESGELFERFMNSDVEKMLSCFEIYYDNLEALQDASDEEAVDLVAKIKKKLENVDSKCLSNEENWWSVLLEQTEIGLT